MSDNAALLGAMPCGLGKIDSFCKAGDVSTAPDIVQLFATPLAIVDVPEAATLNAELRSGIVQREKSHPSTQLSNLGGWQSSWDMDR
jgi:hypothetical protein